MAIVNENGKAYQITNGRVVAAANIEEATPVAESYKIDDRVLHGKKLGKVVSSIPSMYGQAVGVRFDDGSFGEFVPEDLERAAPEKVAKVAGLTTNDEFQIEYEEYSELPIDTLEEVESKMRLARVMNVRAKALASNRHNPLVDNIFYDSVITATAVDLMDLKDQQEAFRVSESRDYLEQLPQFEVPETVSPAFGLTRGGDASWLGMEELEPGPMDEAWLAQQAITTVSALTKEELQDSDLMKQALAYRFEFLPNDPELRTKFAGLVNEARMAKLQAKPVPKIASVEKDLDGNEIALEDLPIEAVFGA